MSLLNGAILTSCAHFSRIIMGFILLKLIAYYLGAEGLGALGHFMSVSTMVYMIAGGGVINGVIKYTAEYSTDSLLLARFISATATYSGVFCGITLLLGIVFSKDLSILVFSDASMSWVIVLLAVAQVLFSFVYLVIGVSNGLMRTRVYSLIQIFGSLLALPIIWISISTLGVAGAAISVIAMYAAPVFPAIYYFLKSEFKSKVRFLKLNRKDVLQLSSYTLMLVATAITFPVVEIIVRQILINGAGYREAGLWQGAMKLSGAYLGFFSVFLAYYFMPMIARIDVPRDIGRPVIKCMMLTMIVFFAGATILYAGREIFIPFILSSGFKDLDDVIVFQLAGDFFRVTSYVIGFVAVAKAATKIYIAAELVQNLLFLGAALLSVNVWPGTKGVMIGYMIAYAVYFAITILVFFIYLKKQNSNGKSDANHC